MPEMSEIPEGRPPATAPASASPAERRRRRRAFWERVYLVACVVGAAALLILRPRLADDQVRSAALGGAIGILAAAIVLILLLVRGRRGHDTMFSREMDGVWDERDRAVKQKMWVVAGRTPCRSCSFFSWYLSHRFRYPVRQSGSLAYSVVAGTALSTTTGLM